MGIMDGSCDGSVSLGCWEALGAPVGCADGWLLGNTEVLGTRDKDGTILGLVDSVGCWEALGVPVGGADGSSIGDREGATEVGLELGT
jgi:hypothetical protein